MIPIQEHILNHGIIKSTKHGIIMRCLKKLNIKYHKFEQGYYRIEWFEEFALESKPTFDTFNAISLLHKFQNISHLTFQGPPEFDFVISYFQSVRTLYLDEATKNRIWYASFLPLLNDVSLHLIGDMRMCRRRSTNLTFDEEDPQDWLQPMSKHRIQKLTIIFNSSVKSIANEIVEYAVSTLKSKCYYGFRKEPSFLRSLKLVNFVGFEQDFDWKVLKMIRHIDIEADMHVDARSTNWEPLIGKLKIYYLVYQQ
jgi:hypothetical protein